MTTLNVPALRRDDFLSLRFEFINLQLPASGKRDTLKRGDPKKDSLIIVHFAPQSIVERSFREADDPQKSEDPAAAPIPSLIAGPSRLVFKVPPADADAGVPFNLTALLLKIGNYEMSVVPAALSFGAESTASGIKLRKPNELAVAANNTPPETAIESPYKLILSPPKQARWAHASELAGDPERVELWHTRLKNEINKPNIVRAIWTEDWTGNEANDPSKKPGDPAQNFSLKPSERHDIVHLSANTGITLKSGNKYAPKPISVEALMLSALGAWMKLGRDWDLGDGLGDLFSLESWRHRSTMGRDHYVRVVQRGYLFPFGHVASKIEITERKFHPNKPGNAAYLRRREYVIVRQPEMFYDQGNRIARQFPFKRLRIVTLTTPSLDDPIDSAIPGDRRVFWINVGNRPFPFHLIGEDWSGRESEFTAPLIFMPSDDGLNNFVLGFAKKEYELGNKDRRTRQFGGQTIALAVPSQPADDKSALEINQVEFGVEVLDAGDAPRFHPVIRNADVQLPSLKRLVGITDAVRIEWDPIYKEKGFGVLDNLGQLFARFVNKDNPAQPGPIALNFDQQGNQAGALAKPNMKLWGLAHSTGLVAATDDAVAATDDPLKGRLSKFAAGDFAATDLFPLPSDWDLPNDLLPKLFGVVPLGAIINLSNLDNIQKLGKMPKFEAPDAAASGGKLASFNFNTPLKDFPNENSGIKNLPFTKPFFLGEGGNISINIESLLNGGQPEFNVSCTLTNFAIKLFPPPFELIQINFKEMTFKSVAGKKPDVIVNLGPIEFLGVLSFVEALKSLIPLDGFSDPPDLDVTADGIAASFTMGLPAIAVGMFSLQNLSFGAMLTIPFIGQPLSLYLHFCERHNPFTLTVSAIGGGGFLGLTLTPKGVEMLEGALEFGASLAMSFGVAAGTLSVMAGIYFQIKQTETTLAGYLRIQGCVNVLGLISASIELYLELKYQISSGKCVGSAQLKIGVKVCFFSKTVTIKCERQFAGSNGDPTFEQLMLPGEGRSPWDEYCQSFA